MRGGDDNLERSPMNQLLGSHGNRAIGTAEYHVGATVEELAQIFTDEHRGAAARCDDGKTVGSAGAADPGTGLRSVVDEGNQLEEGKLRGKRKRRAGNHAAQYGRSCGRHNQSTAESAVLARRVDQALPAFSLRSAFSCFFPRRYSSLRRRTASTRGPESNRTGSVAGKPVSRLASSHARRAASSVIS